MCDRPPVANMLVDEVDPEDGPVNAGEDGEVQGDRRDDPNMEEEDAGVDGDGDEAEDLDGAAPLQEAQNGFGRIYVAHFGGNVGEELNDEYDDPNEVVDPAAVGNVADGPAAVAQEQQQNDDDAVNDADAQQEQNVEGGPGDDDEDAMREIDALFAAMGLHNLGDDPQFALNQMPEDDHVVAPDAGMGAAQWSRVKQLAHAADGHRLQTAVVEDLV